MPHLSVAVQVRLNVPSQGNVPDCVILYDNVGVPQLSVAVASPVTEGMVSAEQETVTVGGQVMTGGVVSSTVTVLQIELLQPTAVMFKQTLNVPQPLKT